MVRAFKIARSHFERYLVEAVGYPHVTIPEQDFSAHFHFARSLSNTLAGGYVRHGTREGEEEDYQSAT
jgi:hypothetical protein